MIETRGLTYRYDGRTVLDGVDLAIADGEFVVLAGRNGAGKTTLVRHFNGLLEPDDGTVLVDGTPVTEDKLAARTRVALVFQDPRDQFVAARVGDDVAFGPENLGLDRDEIDHRVAAALDTVGLREKASATIDSLSGGERTRAAIAGGLAMQPAHLVLDEPLSGLDWDARQALLAHLESLSVDGTGVVVVTHDLRDVADLADRVVVLDDGAVAMTVPPASPEAVAAHGVRPPT